jgi:hypothetical protein
MGIPSRVDIAARCIPLTISTHASAGAWGAGTLPPPLSTLPARTTTAQYCTTLMCFNHAAMHADRRDVRTYEVAADDVGGGVLALDLRHLPDLLGERHAPQQVVDPPVQRLPRVLVPGAAVVLLLLLRPSSFGHCRRRAQAAKKQHEHGGTRRRKDDTVI